MNNNQTEELEIIEHISADVVYQQDKAAIDVQISTAKAFPRNIQRAAKNAVIIVTMDEETAQACTYAVPRGGKKITGPSVHLARILAQTWGNMRIEAKVTDTDQTHVTSEAVCFDLENNLAIKVQVKRRITGSDGRRFNEDMITITGNAANAIALRNSILQVIPRGVVNSVYNAARQKITGDVSDENKMMAKRKQVVDKLISQYNVTEAEVLFSIGKASVDHIDADDIVTLIGIGTAIKDGDTTVDQAFRNKSTNAKPDIDTVNSEKEHKRIMKHIAGSKTLEQLQQVEQALTTDEQQEFYSQREKELSGK